MYLKNSQALVGYYRRIFEGKPPRSHANIIVFSCRTVHIYDGCIVTSPSPAFSFSSLFSLRVLLYAAAKSLVLRVKRAWWNKHHVGGKSRLCCLILFHSIEPCGPCCSRGTTSESCSTWTPMWSLPQR